ncbi:MAG: hypothetical protein RL136_1108 [Planctomycetota bacterium]|jgi:hypothetical protein
MGRVDSIHFKRTLRTASSERLLGLLDGRDAVAVDLHFLPDGRATGTVTVLEACGLGAGGFEAGEIPALLARIDEDFLPGIDLEDGGVTFTVVIARSAESFESAAGA